MPGNLRDIQRVLRYPNESLAILPIVRARRDNDGDICQRRQRLAKSNVLMFAAYRSATSKGASFLLWGNVAVFS